MRILVTGGAGYIGSHTTLLLLAEGHEVEVLDNLSNSSPVALERMGHIAGGPITFHQVDLLDRDATDQVVSRGFDAVIHFAGLKAVGESVEQPLRYYRTNLESTFNLLEAMTRHGVRQLVFSSSATVYGPDGVSPLAEDAPTGATNPYGWTKVFIEQVLRDLAAADAAWRIALLRYFNPIGAHESGLIGEDPQGIPNNLVPYIAQVAVGRREHLTVHGDDYDTVDGTGVRDYIHVDDLARGHVAALDQLARMDHPVGVWNLGTGGGVSVLQMVEAFRQVTGREIPVRVGPRRAGDLAQAFASVDKAADELGWRAEKRLAEMAADTWRWQRGNPRGYEG
ncbi:UDP-glucose 4-epimerase GalE [Kytococcus sedentarius]|uniref:UDP-glucose 4-epimerase n=1 Tax=Kytococcus sedentarius (strain ATCC 14392 / DSM 20547 / JCM 11482 / CCUG 33030 / NBRC 15357 / NCTC 11040 / CCM 314 / 541) TaxID=478801 RepID=C7NJV6_KYTSD|nr:UDP-glucose 4-epimerase GalE [Kytococcus sedentarius]ACV06888.1 UDP-galactose 4-epimerase [Kytococcus sedentarius DSM 20547]QQB62902.1 UDP-glucose 4-epimerase GalE [Kytococcus sedentarius]STX14287.1 UDP-glucose 4-epimerase [Kytococcus sedentarius]